MRRGLWALFGLVILGLAGCTGKGSPADALTSDAGDSIQNTNEPPRSAGLAAPAPGTPLPNPIHEEREVVLEFDPFNVVEGAPCSTDFSACHRYPFDLTAAMFNATTRQIRVTADLSWSLATNDFDLYLYEGPRELVQAASSPPSDHEGFQYDTNRGGHFQVIVVSWFVPRDTYTLDVGFSATQQ